jgi:hypothetical protein
LGVLDSGELRYGIFLKPVRQFMAIVSRALLFYLPESPDDVLRYVLVKVEFQAASKPSSYSTASSTACVETPYQSAIDSFVCVGSLAFMA